MFAFSKVWAHSHSFLLSLLENTPEKSAQGTRAWEPGSIMVDWWTNIGSFLPSFLEIGLWSVSTDMHTSVPPTAAYCPVVNMYPEVDILLPVNKQRKLHVPLKFDGSLNPAHFQGQVLPNFLCCIYVSSSWHVGKQSWHTHSELKINTLKAKNSVIKISTQTPKLLEVFRTSREELCSFPF